MINTIASVMYRVTNIIVCSEHVDHAASIINYELQCLGSDGINVSRRIRIIVHSQFDSVDVLAEYKEYNNRSICRCQSASIPPAEFKLCHFIGK